MIYEYKCEKCNTVVEKVYSMQQEKPQKVKCPECATQTAYRVFSNTTTHIPVDFGSTDNRIKTEKKPNKRFY